MLWMMSLVLLVCDAGAGIILTEGSDGIVHGVVTMMSRRNLNGKMLSFPMELWRMQREQQRGGDPWKQRVHAIAPSPELLSYCDKEGWGYRFTCVEVRECWACSVWPPASCVYVARPLRLLERAQVQHLTQQAVSELQRCLVADLCNHYAFILHPQLYDRLKMFEAANPRPKNIDMIVKVVDTNGSVQSYNLNELCTGEGQQVSGVLPASIHDARQIIENDVGAQLEPFTMAIPVEAADRSVRATIYLFLEYCAHVH
jgi:hypothetical protein